MAILDPKQTPLLISRRELFQRLGLVTAGVLTTGIATACAAETQPSGGEDGGAGGAGAPPAPQPEPGEFSEEQAAAQLEVIQRGYNAFNEGNIDSIGELFTEDATWLLHDPDRTRVHTRIEGRDAIVDFLRNAREHFGAEILDMFPWQGGFALAQQIDQVTAAAFSFQDERVHLVGCCDQGAYTGLVQRP